MKRVCLVLMVILMTVMLFMPIVSASWYRTYTKSPEHESRSVIDATDSFNETVDVPVDDMYNEIKDGVDRGVPDETEVGTNVSVSLKPEEVKVSANDSSVDTNETLAEGENYSDTFESCEVLPDVVGDVTVKSAPDMGYDNYTDTVWTDEENASSNVTVDSDGHLKATGNGAYWLSTWNEQYGADDEGLIYRIVNGSASVADGINHTVYWRTSAGESWHDNITYLYDMKVERYQLMVSLNYEETTKSGGEENTFLINNGDGVFDTAYNADLEKVVVAEDDANDGSFAVTCRNTDDGSLAWEQTYTSYNVDAVEAEGGYVFWGTNDNFYVYDIDGNYIDSDSINDISVYDVDYNYSDGYVAVATGSNYRFYSFDGTALNEQWYTNMGSVNQDHFAVEIDGNENSVYLGGSDSNGNGHVWKRSYSNTAQADVSPSSYPVSEIDTNSNHVVSICGDNGYVSAYEKSDVAAGSLVWSVDWSLWYYGWGALKKPDWTDEYFYISAQTGSSTGHTESLYFSNGSETSEYCWFPDIGVETSIGLGNETVVASDCRDSSSTNIQSWTEPYTYTESSYGECYYVNNSYVDTTEFEFLGTEYSAYVEGETVPIDESGLESMTLKNHHDTATYRLDYDVNYEAEWNASAPPVEMRVELYSTGWEMIGSFWVTVEWNETTGIEFEDVNYTELSYLGLTVNDSELGDSGYLSFDDDENNVETTLYWKLKYLTGYSKVYMAVASPQFWGLFAPLLLATAVGAKTRNANVASMSFMFFLGMTTLMGLSHPFILFVTIFTFAVYYGIQMKGSSQDTSTGSTNER